ncbi:MAG: type II toxin-antitoxin system HicB family antitoxin [Heteroscytonema crispum UTEX LB 1556]
MMNLSIKTSYLHSSPKLTYDILIENEPDGNVSARVIVLPDCKATGATKQEALTLLSQLLQKRLETAEIVTLEIELSKAEHPWMKFAGKYKDDPQFDEMLADIEAYRRELDAEMAEYYQQLDAENEVK